MLLIFVRVLSKNTYPLYKRNVFIRANLQVTFKRSNAFTVPLDIVTQDVTVISDLTKVTVTDTCRKDCYPLLLPVVFF